MLLQVTESAASDEMLGWGLEVYNTPNRKCVSETAKEKQCMGGSTTFTIFQLLLEQGTVAHQQMLYSPSCSFSAVVPLLH